MVEDLPNLGATRSNGAHLGLPEASTSLIDLVAPSVAARFAECGRNVRLSAFPPLVCNIVALSASTE